MKKRELKIYEWHVQYKSPVSGRNHEIYTHAKTALEVLMWFHKNPVFEACEITVIEREDTYDK